MKQFVVMGGALGVNSFTGNVTPCAEANIGIDPHAADIVFRAPLPLTMVGLDVTMKTVMSTEYINHLKNTGGEVGEFIYDISRLYDPFHRETVGMDGFAVHDSSAIAYVIDPDLFEVVTGGLRAVTEGIAYCLRAKISHRVPGIMCLTNESVSTWIQKNFSIYINRLLPVNNKI